MNKYMEKLKKASKKDLLFGGICFLIAIGLLIYFITLF